MTTASPDSFLTRALQFSPDELDLNRAGAASPAQLARLQQRLSAQQRGLYAGLGIAGLLAASAFVRKARSQGLPSFNLAELGPGMLIPAAMLALYIGVMLFAVLRGYKLGAAQRARAVEGKAKIGFVKAANKQTEELMRRMGTPRGKLTIGRKTFHVDEETLAAFRPGATYRVYFVKHFMANLLISAEALGDA